MTPLDSLTPDVDFIPGIIAEISALARPGEPILATARRLIVTEAAVRARDGVGVARQLGMSKSSAWRCLNAHGLQQPCRRWNR